MARGLSAPSLCPMDIISLGDAQAAQSVALLLHFGVGGAAKDATGSARWHAVAAALGNVDGLATLGGCLRVGAGIIQNEQLGVAIIRYVHPSFQHEEALAMLASVYVYVLFWIVLESSSSV